MEPNKNSSGVQGFLGKIDDVRIYNQVVLPSTYEDFSADLILCPDPEDIPYGQWQFDNNGDNENLSGNQATLIGGASFSSDRKSGTHSLSLNGNGQHALLTKPSSSSYLHEAFDQRAIAFWIKPSSLFYHNFNGFSNISEILAEIQSDCPSSPKLLLKDLSSDLPVKPFPNPFSDRITIPFSPSLIEGKNVRIQLFSVSGQVVESDIRKVVSTSIDMELDFPAGIYILRLTQDNYQESHRLLKTN